MKTCTKCLIEKPETEYFTKDKKTGRLHAQCKACYKDHRQAYYSEHYAKYRSEYLSRAKQRRERLRTEFHKHMIDFLMDKSCVNCGERDIRVLELDHLDPAQKTFSISQALRSGYSWNEVIEETKKCQILCANCHKKRTSIQFKWYKA